MDWLCKVWVFIQDVCVLQQGSGWSGFVDWLGVESLVFHHLSIGHRRYSRKFCLLYFLYSLIVFELNSFEPSFLATIVVKFTLITVWLLDRSRPLKWPKYQLLLILRLFISIFCLYRHHLYILFFICIFLKDSYLFRGPKSFDLFLFQRLVWRIRRNGFGIDGVSHFSIWWIGLWSCWRFAFILF